MTGSSAAFSSRAEAYCRFIESAGNLPLPQRLRRAQDELIALYTAALALPDTEPGEEDATHVGRPAGWPGFGDVDVYWEVADPYLNAAPIAASLTDDLLDIYSDLRAGLVLLRGGGITAEATATWHWRFSFQTHWGDHAIDALRALHRASLRHPF